MIQELIKAQSDTIDVLKENLKHERELKQVYKEHLEKLQTQLDHSMDLLNRSLEIIKQYKTIVEQ